MIKLFIQLYDLMHFRVRTFDFVIFAVSEETGLLNIFFISARDKGCSINYGSHKV